MFWSLRLSAQRVPLRHLSRPNAGTPSSLRAGSYFATGYNGGGLARIASASAVQAVIIMLRLSRTVEGARIANDAKSPQDESIPSLDDVA
jgi:hypothetical protein